MRFKNTNLTQILEEWLASRGDGAPLLVRQEGQDILIMRQDGSEPLAREVARCRRVLATHATQPLTTGPSPKKPRRGGRPVYKTETAKRREAGLVAIRLYPEEAESWRSWAAEHGGLAAHARWLLAERVGKKNSTP